MAEVLDFRDWEKLSHKLAHQFRRAVQRRGLAISYDEALSEVQLRWVIARDGFKPELGFAFSTYFTSAVRYAVTPYVQAQKQEPFNIGAVCLDDHVGGDDDVGTLRHETIADENARDPEQAMLTQDAQDLMQRRTPLLATLVAIMREQPDELQHELQALAAQRRYAEQIGVSLPRDSEAVALTPKVLGRIFGFNWKQRLRLREEMDEVLQHV